MVTARTIVKKALQKIGALVKNEDPSSDEANDGLDALNALIGSWGNDSLNIYARTWETFSLVSGTGSYTIGSSGVFNTVRPSNIAQAYMRDSTIDHPIAVIEDEQYNNISFKSISGYPEFLNYDGGFPLGTIRLYPIPASNYSLFLLTEKPLTEFATLDTALSMPLGTERALIYNLGIDLAPEYSQQISAEHAKIAAESLGLIRTKTAQVRGMDAYPQVTRTRNILSGYY